MIEGPLGGAAFNNEFGRPALLGYFRTYEEKVNSFNGEEVRGYHKPIMLAGGIGNIRGEHVQKGEIPVGAKLIVLGGPAMNIGLGGGAASSMDSGKSKENLDFASVQRENPEMERRCQEVIDRCWQLGEENPILFIQTWVQVVYPTRCLNWYTMANVAVNLTYVPSFVMKKGCRH